MRAGHWIEIGWVRKVIRDPDRFGSDGSPATLAGSGTAGSTPDFGIHVFGDTHGQWIQWALEID